MHGNIKRRANLSGRDEVGIMAMLRAGLTRNHGSIPGTARDFSGLPNDQVVS
jgi:hypothetical protein